MSPTAARRRGRPAKESFDPAGRHLRRMREDRRLTVRALAVRVGLKESAASYISQLESGAKFPSPGLALRLAEALGDDPRIYAAWAALGRRSDVAGTMRKLQALMDLLAAGGPAEGTIAPRAESAAAAPEPADEAVLAPVGSTAREHFEGLHGPAPRAVPPRAPGEEVPPSRILVPVLEEGADPRDPRQAAVRGEPLRLDPRVMAAVEPLRQPFAYRATEPAARRVRDLLGPGDAAVLTRRAWPIERGEVYGVLLSGHVALARVLWNGRHLLLLPAPGESDFLVLEALDRAAIERLVVGKLAAIVRPPR